MFISNILAAGPPLGSGGPNMHIENTISAYLYNKKLYKSHRTGTHNALGVSVEYLHMLIYIGTLIITLQQLRHVIFSAEISSRV